MADELAELKAQMISAATDPEHYAEIADIAGAEQSAREGDESGVLSRLRGVGRFSLDVAARIGLPLAVEAIKREIGLASA